MLMESKVFLVTYFDFVMKEGNIFLGKNYLTSTVHKFSH